MGKYDWSKHYTPDPPWWGWVLAGLVFVFSIAGLVWLVDVAVSIIALVIILAVVMVWSEEW